MTRDDELRILFDKMGCQIKDGAPSFESCLTNDAVPRSNTRKLSTRFLMPIAASGLIVLGSFFFWPGKKGLKTSDEIALISTWRAPTDVLLTSDLRSMEITTWMNPTDILLIELK